MADPRVDEFLHKAGRWQKEMSLLRDIVAGIEELREDYKWMHPCYTFNGKNVVLIDDFKAYCALLFHKGALLSDPEGILIQQTENVQAARQLRFTSLDQIEEQRYVIESFIRQAIDVERSGKTVVLKKTSDYTVPEEFQRRLDESDMLREAFAKLTPGRQRAYLFYFSTAKQPTTRESRIDKYIPKILDGKGLDD